MNLENGTMGDIKVMNSSTFRLLDESAKESVARSRVTKKLPYRVIVHLPITYRLQESKRNDPICMYCAFLRRLNPFEIPAVREGLMKGRPLS